MALTIKLWTINHWLRWTGFRMTLHVGWRFDESTGIGIEWFGLPGSKGWKQIERTSNDEPT